MAEPNRKSSKLEEYLRERQRQQPILLMTHIVLGYPDFDTSLRLVETMVSAGVDLMELQIPFSEPIADGPVILRANQESLTGGATVNRCFALAGEVAKRFDIPFLFMSYYNVLFRHGVKRFAERMSASKLRGAIVPDLPPEEASEYLSAMDANGLDPIFIYSPNTTDARLRRIAEIVARVHLLRRSEGCDRKQHPVSNNLSAYLERARAATTLPLAVGFGVKDRADVEFLRGKADIAVVGSEAIRALGTGGVSAVGRLLSGLR